MYILGIDTSSNMLTVALSDNNKILTEIHTDKQMGLLQNLAPAAESVLYENNIDVNDLGAVAVSLGPGSFTGLRIGIAYAKTMAYVLNIPIIGVPTMKALAKSCENSYADIICPMIFARVNEIYCSVFSGDLKEKYMDYTFMTVEELLDNPMFNDKKCIFLGTGAIKHRELIKEKVKNAIVCDENYNYVKGFCLNSLAYNLIIRNETDNVRTLVPLYIKKPTPVIRLERGNK